MMVAAVGTGARQVDRRVNGVSVSIGELLRKPPYEVNPLYWGQFGGQEHEHFATESCVTAVGAFPAFQSVERSRAQPTVASREKIEGSTISVTSIAARSG
jgi:hypothetical protein